MNTRNVLTASEARKALLADLDLKRVEELERRRYLKIVDVVVYVFYEEQGDLPRPITPHVLHLSESAARGLFAEPYVQKELGKVIHE